MGKNNAFLPNLEPYIALGINPATEQPIRAGETCNYKTNVLNLLQVMDLQNAVNRYKWYNLPGSLSSQELERLLYLKGQLCFFYDKNNDDFYFMPYALDGGIDFYGRYNTIHPIPMTMGTTDAEKKQNRIQETYLSTLKLNVLYDIPLEPIDFSQYTVLLHDYTKQFSQTTISRSTIQQGILDIMSDCIPFMRTALANSTGVQGMRVDNETEQSNVAVANNSVTRAALNGKKWIPVVGNLEFQDLTGGEVAKAEEFLLAMQGLDNFRLSLYGLDNGGLFQKKSHMLEAEQQMNTGKASLPLQDGLSIRQRFCDIVNACTGLGIYCEISESVRWI